MKLHCNYIDITDLDNPDLYIYFGWSKYQFGTKIVSCGWCQRINCDTYTQCTRRHNKNDNSLCADWKIDY